MARETQTLVLEGNEKKLRRLKKQGWFEICRRMICEKTVVELAR